MFKYLPALLLILLISTLKANAQTYSLDNGFTAGGSVTTCTGFFKDSNRFGSYNSNEDYTVTFNPNSPASVMQVQFDTLALGTGDTLWIHDGANQTAPVLIYFVRNDNLLTIRASATNTSGALTFRFKSDNSGVGNGWNARISCNSPCQTIVGNIVTTVPATDALSFVNICQGQEITFTGAGTYPQNNIFYAQSDATSRFSWRISDGRDTSGISARTIKRRFNNEGGYVVELKIIDGEGCTSTNKSLVKVRTGIKPKFNVQAPPPTCTADTIRISAAPQMPVGSFTNPPVVADSIFLPDGVGVCYNTSLNITQFAPGQTLNNINDLEGILLNMEHSWLGDIDIAITAPNGVRVRLKYTTGTSTGWESFLGEPVDEPSTTSPLAQVAGKGYDYLFSPNPTYGSMTSERGRYRYSYVDNAGQQVSNKFHLPAGSYASEESLNALLGTPLNGQWRIQVCDRYAADNGFIFYWTVKFKASLYPDPELYNTSLATVNWTPATSLISSNNTSAVFVPNTAGTIPYTYSVTDNFGCTYDTTFNVTVHPLPVKPNLGADTAICDGQTITLNIASPQAGITYNWSTGASGVSSINATQAATYWVQAQNTFGCKSRDTLIVRANAPITMSIGNDTMYCASSPNVLSAVSSQPLTAYSWSNGSSNATYTINGPGTYWLEAKDAAGCRVRDTIVVTQNPINSFVMPNDTSICELTSYSLALTPPAGTIVTWSDGSTGLSHLINGGTYGITANYQGCTRQDNMVVAIRPLPRVYLGKDTSLCYGFELPLKVSFQGATFRWSTGSTDSSIIANSAATYWVQATLNGCNYRDTLVMTQKSCSCDVQIPNAFSPNGDGINDVFAPKIECFPADYHLSIFNRYGQQVFDTRESKNYWNGTMNGNSLPIGTYYYVLTFYNQNLMKSEQFTGSITLLK